MRCSAWAGVPAGRVGGWAGRGTRAGATRLAPKRRPPTRRRPQFSQRVASFLLYLNEWEEGGETIFPLEGPGGIARLNVHFYRFLMIRFWRFSALFFCGYSHQSSPQTVSSHPPASPTSQGIDYRSCEMGLKFKPAQTGDAVVFWNMHPNGTFDKARSTASERVRSVSYGTRGVSFLVGA